MPDRTRTNDVSLSDTTQKPINVTRMRNVACHHDDLDVFLQYAGENVKTDDNLKSQYLCKAVLYNSISIVRHLLENEGASVDRVTVFDASSYPSVEMLQPLVSFGWNINMQDDKRDRLGNHVLLRLCSDEMLIRCCLDLGAAPKAISYNPDSPWVYYERSLLEMAGRSGSIATVKLLREAGASLTQRILHEAVSSGGSEERIGMVKYLLDDVGLDVNGMDFPDDSAITLRYGTPICYAAISDFKTEELIRLLLSRGADPTITPPHFVPNISPPDQLKEFDAYHCAKWWPQDGVDNALREWREEYGKRQ